MAHSSPKLFPKPTAIAILAAIVGVAVHGAVFFLLRIEVETPAVFETSAKPLSYLGVSEPDSVAFIDPLTLLIRSNEKDLDTGLEDFRSLSISREISPFPPFLAIKENRNWASWITPEVTEQNPSAWLLERSESSLQDFGREGLPAIQLAPDRILLTAHNLIAGEITSSSLEIPEAVLESMRGTPFLNPVSFLLDRTDTWSRPSALLVDSSGVAAVDQSLKDWISSGESGSSRGNGYFLVTAFLPPPPDDSTRP